MLKPQQYVTDLTAEAYVHVCDVKRKQAAISGLLTLCQCIPLISLTQDSCVLIVKDVSSLKDPQKRPLMTLTRPPEQQKRDKSSRRKRNQFIC